MRPVDALIDQIDTLTLLESRRLAGALDRYIAQLEQWQRPALGVVEQLPAAGGCYRLEYVNCGKAKCSKCAKGPSHGPYWYHYAYDAGRGRQRKTYIGKQRPSQEGSPDRQDSGGASPE